MLWYTACTTSFLIRIFIVFAVGRSKIRRSLQRPINTIGALHDQKMTRMLKLPWLKQMLIRWW